MASGNGEESMNTRKVAATAAVFLIVVGVFFWWFSGAPGPASNTVAAPVVNAVQPTSAPSKQDAHQQPRTVVQSSAPKSVAEDWRHAFDRGAGVVEAFTATVQAAEAGDPRAVLILRSYVAQCAPFFASAYQPWMDKPGSLPPGGLEELPIDERCMLISHAPQFADRSREDKLGPAYWERVAERVDEPLAVSFRAVGELAKLHTAPPDERADVQASITADLRHVLRSGDPTAWFDLASHGAAQGENGDPSYGFALALGACDLGYDWKYSTGKDGATETMEQRLKAILSPDLYAKTEARYLELQALIRAGNWAEIENFLPPDNPAFR
jgi:hypothetical protein